MDQNYTITIEQTAEFPQAEFKVAVNGATKTVHSVTLSQEYYHKLTGGEVSAKNLIRASFEFLLDREPNTAILQAFDLPVISEYFSEYEDTIKETIGSN